MNKWRCLLFFWSALAIPGTCLAGLFGPSNFDECVLDKMKGQPPTMLAYARSACERLFPPNIELREGEHYQAGQIKTRWIDNTTDEAKVELQNSTSYKIVRVDGQFWKKPCEDQSDAFDSVKVSTEPPRFGSTLSFPLKQASTYKCARFVFYAKKLQP